MPFSSTDAAQSGKTRKILEQSFRFAVFTLLVKKSAIAEALAARMLARRHSGFSAHNQVRVPGDDAAGRIKLAQYMLRVPMSLEKMSYDPRTGMVTYRSHMRASLKRNFQLMLGAQWLELLCRHTPDRFEHLGRYVGWYSNRSRGKRARAAASREVSLGNAEVSVGPAIEDTESNAVRARSTWARLITSTGGSRRIEFEAIWSALLVNMLFPNIDNSKVIL